MLIPTDKEIQTLHEKYAPTREAYDLVYTHCEIVCEIAEQILDRTALDLNADLVRASCLLHDIGVYRLYNSAGELDHARYCLCGMNKSGRSLRRIPHRGVTAASYADQVRRFGEDKAVTFTSMCERFGEPDLVSFSAKYGYTLV
jgi:uncharacterized protein